MRKSAFLLCLTLAACGPRVTPVVQGDPTATAALLAMPETQFFAQSQLAQQIAGKCATIGYNQRFSDAVAVQRFGDEAAARRGRNQNGLGLEVDVGQRSLQARYDTSFEAADLCAIGTGELARKSALSAILIPL